MKQAAKLVTNFAFPGLVLMHLYLAFAGSQPASLIGLLAMAFPLMVYCLLDDDKRTLFAVWFVGAHVVYFAFLAVTGMPVDKAFMVGILTATPLAMGAGLIRTTLKKFI